MGNKRQRDGVQEEGENKSEQQSESGKQGVQYYIQAFYWHEEGTGRYFRTFKLPVNLREKAVRDKLHTSLQFIKSIVPDENGKCLDRTPFLFDPYKSPPKGATWMFQFLPSDDADDDVDNEASDDDDLEARLQFNVLMYALCGPPVEVDATQPCQVHHVSVPTSD